MVGASVRESRIGGLGLFVEEAVGAGEIIRKLSFDREVTTEAPLRPEAGELAEHAALIDGRFVLVAGPDRYFNHSCDPNAYLRFDTDGVRAIARRDIEAGEELTLDYLINNSGGDSWPCNCGAARCRGETAHSFFDLPVEIQREYRPLLAAWFVKRHGAQLEERHREGGELL